MMKLKTYFLLLFFIPLSLFANSEVYESVVQPEIVIAPLQTFEKEIIKHKKVSFDFSSLIRLAPEKTPTLFPAKTLPKDIKTNVVIDDVIVFLQEKTSIEDVWVYSSSNQESTSIPNLYHPSPG